MDNHYHDLGNSLQESGRFDEAVAAYKKAIELNPNFSWSYHCLGDVLLKLEKWEEAVAAYKKSVELNPDFSWSYHNLGDALLKIRQWEEAAVAYRCEIALNSDFAWSFCNLGDALTKIKQWDEAIATYLKAVEIDGDLPGIYEKLGYALGQTESDLNLVLEQSQLQIKPENWEFYLQLGENLAKYDRPKSAIIFYQALLTAMPSCGSVSAELEELLQQQEKCVSVALEEDRALASSRATVAQKPDDCWSYYNLGAVLSHQKYWEEAAAAFFQAIEINPDLPWWFYYNLWEVFVRQNKLDEVEKLCREVVAAKPEAFWPYLNLGEALTRQGKIAEAIDFYRTVSYKQSFASIISKRTGKMPVSQEETGKMPVPQEETGKMPVSQEETGKMPVSQEETGKMPVSQEETGKMPVSQEETGKMPVPQEETGKMPVPQEETGKMPVPQNWNLKPVKVPNFIIIGCQRCGTTSLYTYLAQHPQILTPIKKEMDFFSWHFDRGIDWYLAHFPPMPPGEEFLTGEASPSYFDSREAPERLYSLFPEAKLIVLLRNPVDRAISQFYRLTNLNWEARSLDRVISDEIERLNQNPEYIIGEEPGNYLARGRYIEFIKNWRTFFPPEQLLILKSEDFYAGAATTVKQVLEFLDLPEYQLSEYQNANPGSYQPVNQSVRDWLRDYFRPYNQQLEEYLCRKLDW
ncbi:tetratricopeptide repeat protein [Microcoleus sp. OTE_8_concoct_300]|uniref:tetratricopeptide repeat protein n=1 Tax=Microcoleus sp. OTE_8_concoct_300 TaxID=2964710 RepID=UPI00403F2BA2